MACVNVERGGVGKSRSTLTFTFLGAVNDTVGVGTEDGGHGIGNRRSHDSLTESQRCDMDGPKDDGGRKSIGSWIDKRDFAP